MLTSLFTKAEDEITPLCWENGLFSFHVTGTNGIATIVIVDGNNNPITGTGAYSSTFTITGGTAIITVSQPIRITTIRIRITYSSGSYKVKSSTTNACNIVPIILTNLSLQRDGEYIIVQFTVENEVGVGSYKVELSEDGINWITKYIIFTDITPKGKYTIKFKQ